VSKWHDALEDPVNKNETKLLDEDATPNIKEFKKVFEQYVITEQHQKPHVILQPNMLLQVAQRCVKSHFWKPLSVLIDSECVSLSMVPNLLEKAMEENLLDIIVSCVRHMRDINDEDIVTLIKYLLQTDRKLLTASAAKILNVDAGTIDNKRALHLFLDTVFAFKRENLFIYNWLKTLTLDELKEIMEYLYEWIHAYAECCDVSLPPQSLGERIVVLPYKNVLNWIAMLTDTHYTMFIFSKELHSVVNNINKCVQDEQKMCQQLSTFSGYLKQLEASNKSNLQGGDKTRRGSISDFHTSAQTRKGDIGLYSIEVLSV